MGNKRSRKFGKNIRIVKELMTYCHLLGATGFHLDMELEPGVSIYHLQANVQRFTEANRLEILDKLNYPRQPEVEQNYWGLSGESDSHVDLTLVGMMVDEAEVDWRDGQLHITVRRKEKK